MSAASHERILVAALEGRYPQVMTELQADTIDNLPAVILAIGSPAPASQIPGIVQTAAVADVDLHVIAEDYDDALDLAQRLTDDLRDLPCTATRWGYVGEVYVIALPHPVPAVDMASDLHQVTLTATVTVRA